MSDGSDIEMVSAVDHWSSSRSPPLRMSTLPAAAKEVRIVPSPILNLDEYEFVEGSDEVYKVLEESESADGMVEYEVMFGDTHVATVSKLHAKEERAQIDDYLVVRFAGYCLTHPLHFYQLLPPF